MTDDGRGDDAVADGDDEAPLPPDVTVERATVDAADTVADLWVDLARDQRVHGSHLEPAANRSTARDEAARMAVTGGLFVAREETAPEDEDRQGTDGDGRVVGFVTASAETPAYEQDTDRGLVHNLYVRPDERGRGIGAALLDAAEAHLREQGVDRVALEAMADNEPARRFYRRQGYTAHRVELEKGLDAGTPREEPGEDDGTDRDPGAADGDR